jgi:hypothetical protein
MFRVQGDMNPLVSHVLYNYNDIDNITIQISLQMYP